MNQKKILIMGAAGRDFHNFNLRYRDNEEFEVVAFTATQIPDIQGRVYPAELAGKLYPNGIPIFPEEELLDLIKQHQVNSVVFAYSDVPYEYVMHKAAQVNAAGADFVLLDTESTSIKSKVPVVSICATRTGCGKSQTTRRVSEILKSFGKKVITDDLNLSVKDKEFLAIIGRSGEGKSVLLKQIIGLIIPDSGEVIVDGQDITNLKGVEKQLIYRKCGYVFQFAALLDSLNVFQNIGITKLEKGIPPKIVEKKVLEKHKYMIDKLAGAAKRKQRRKKDVRIIPEIISDVAEEEKQKPASKKEVVIKEEDSFSMKL